ncbi:MAG: hypothetical protein ACYDCQ_15330 [Dehalococcoidia bacterium]
MISLRVRTAAPTVAPAAIAAAAVVALAAGIGAAAAHDRTPELAGVGLLLLAFGVGVHNWRWSLYGLILYVPVSGIPWIVSYPNTTLAVLAKDLLFVLPAYVGFLGSLIPRRASLPPDRAVLTLFALFAGLVAVQVFNPASGNVRVGAIGAKVWLLYLPMYVLGYALIETRQDLQRLLGLMSLAAVVPAIVGVTEAALIYSGRGSAVYTLYGAAADVATQHFAAITFAAGHAIFRVPSTFSYGAQFYGFLATSVAVSWAWWRGFLVETRWTHAGAVLWGLLVLAALLTGQLGAFIFIPLLIAMMLWLNGPRELLAGRYLLLGGLGAAGASTVIGAARGADLLREALQTGAMEFKLLFIDGLSQSFAKAMLGLGTGTDTSASRYAFTNQTAFTAPQEAWYVKALLELGVIGLVLVFVVLLTLLLRALKLHWRLSDRGLRAASAAIIAFVIWNILYNVKSSFMDLDPINVYFWLLAGVLGRIAILGGHLGNAAIVIEPADISTRRKPAAVTTRAAP